jgi:hypothetical protein
MADATDNLVRVARALQRLGLFDVAYVGGAAVETYITDPALLAPRVTQDVDVVLDVATRADFYAVESLLLEAGHEPDEAGPVGRWRVEGVPVDLTPASARVLGFTNRWYRLLLDTAIVREVASSITVRVATPAMFLAAKLEAHHDRGASDPMMSRDLTDVVALVNGRASLHREAGEVPVEHDITSTDVRLEQHRHRRRASRCSSSQPAYRRVSGPIARKPSLHHITLS